MAAHAPSLQTTWSPALLTLTLLSGLSPVAGAAEVCPPYRQDRPLRCAWGYVHVSPAGLLVPLGQVHNDYADSPRLGMSVGLGAGIFRAIGRLGWAVGARLGHGFTRQRFGQTVSLDQYLHVGPELRLGGVGPRYFAFALLRGGYSGYPGYLTRRTSIASPAPVAGHLGVGAGAWAHLGSRFMVGGELVVDVLINSELRPLTLSLSLGLWL